MPVRLHGTARLPLDGFSLNLVIFENLSRKFKFSENLSRITDTVHGDQYTFLVISRTVFRMKSVSDKSCRENQNTLYVVQ